MDKSGESTVKAGPQGDYFDYKVYEIFFKQEDNGLFDGDTCTDYSKKDFTYDDCILENFGNYLKQSYGCLFMPPWMNFTCGNHADMNISENNLDIELLDKAWGNINKLTDGMIIDAMKICKPPCKR